MAAKQLRRSSAKASHALLSRQMCMLWQLREDDRLLRRARSALRDAVNGWCLEEDEEPRAGVERLIRAIDRRLGVRPPKRRRA